ncbi:MAG: TIGR04222 domain-containing membrane protein [Nocardiaceae bacterium]|nr:TIGR04222 domain-containing membrane protein [Nocardiaceae bacterium]
MITNTGLHLSPGMLWFLSLLVASAICAPALVWLAALRVWPRVPVPEGLAPSQIGYLIDADHAVSAALVQLRQAGLIDVEGSPCPVEPVAVAAVDDFALAVLHRISSGTSPAVGTLTKVSWAELGTLQWTLRDHALLVPDKFRRLRNIALVPGILVIAAALLNKYGGFVNGGTTFFVAVSSTVTAMLVFDCPRLTARGHRAVRKAQRDFRHLNPDEVTTPAALSPFLAGMSVALFGSPALTHIDADFADNVNAPRSKRLAGARKGVAAVLAALLLPS